MGDVLVWEGGESAVMGRCRLGWLTLLKEGKRRCTLLGWIEVEEVVVALYSMAYR